MIASVRERALTLTCTALGRIAPHQSVSTPLSKRTKRLLVVKPCCIGDVLGVPRVIESVRDAFPDAEIDLLTSSWSRHAAETCTALTQILEWPRAERGVVQAAGLLTTIRALRKRRYQLALTLDRSPVVGVLTLLSGIPIRAGYDSGGRGFGLNRRLKVTMFAHEHDLAASLLEALGIAFTADPPYYRVPELAKRMAEALLKKAGVDRERPFAVIAPGGGSNPGAAMFGKRWSPDGYAALAARFADTGFQVLLVGSATDASIARSIRLNSAPHVRDLTGQTALPELAAIIAAARLYVGNDSGTTHLAAAVGCATVAIFGPTDPNLYGPRGANVAIVAAPPSARDRGHGTVLNPWFRGVDWHAAVRVDQIWAALRSLDVLPCRR